MLSANLSNSKTNLRQAVNARSASDRRSVGVSSIKCKQATVRVSVCTVLYKSSDVIEAYFKALAQNVSRVDEVLFYDNASDACEEEKVTELAERYGIDIKYWSGGENIGFAKACNFLSLQATGTRLIFLNPDAQTFDFAIDTHRPNQIVGATIFDLRGGVGGMSGQKRGIWDEVKSRWLRISAPYPFEYGYVSGAALSVDRTEFLKAGGFDEKFFMYYEDIDLCFRMNLIGLSVRVEDSWHVVHSGGSSAKKIKSISLQRSYESSIYFHDKWEHNVSVYKVFSLVDASTRVILWLLKNDRESRKAYQSLVKRIVSRPNSAKGIIS